MLGINKDGSINFLKLTFWAIILGIFIGTPIMLLTDYILRFWIKNETVASLIAGACVGMVMGIIISLILNKTSGVRKKHTD